MKKWTVSFLIVAMFGSLFSSAASAASKPSSFVSVVMDGKKIWFPDAQAFIDENERTLVPVRFVAESLGAKVGWEAETQTVPITRVDQSIILTINQNVVRVDNKTITLDTKAILRGGRTFVPLRFVTEVLGGQVDWDGPTATVFIKTSESTAQTDPWGRLIRTNDLPKNASDYPYILADIPNEMYEMDYPFSHPTDSKVSAVLYSTKSEFNKQNVDIWMGRLKAYGALWLNVDYKTIDDAWAKAVFATKMQNSDAELKYIRRYVDWVKENHIQIEGYLDPEPSMIYKDGFGNNFVRSKFRIKFISYKTSNDLLYDEWFPKTQTFEKGVWYEGYTDISLSTNVGGDWGSTLKVDPNASLFRNHIIRKADSN